MPVPHEPITRAAYDLVAEDYARVLDGLYEANPWDQAVLAAFAATVVADGDARVLDLGCGTGRLTGHLADLGLHVSGLDLSPGMLAFARRAHPQIAFTCGTMAALPHADSELDGIVAWYSVIHTPPSEHPAIFQELARALRPDGHLVVAFQIGNERVHLDHAYGRDLDLDAYRLDPDAVGRDLEAAGFTITARVERKPIDPEPQRQAYLTARSPARR